MTPSQDTAATPSTFSRMQKLTPVLVVDTIEPCLRFWVDRLGFQRTTEVPSDEGGLAFVILEKDGIEIMYQTRESIAKDDEPLAQSYAGHSIALFMEVSDLDTVERAMHGVDMVVPRHDTFYGTTEFYVREPAGNVVGFSAKR